MLVVPGASAPPVLERGDVVGGAYRVEARIGGGGMGAVYRARRLADDRAVALKVVRDATPDLVARLEREAQITGSIDHPNLIRVHDVLRDEHGAPVVVMELLHGETLGQRLAREGTLPVAEVARIALGILGALEAAHARTVVHRDLKPDNVFLTSASGQPFVKVLDFGIAKAVEGASVIEGLPTLETRTGHILGTPQYMAPEQIFGEKDVDYRADVWALGVVIYEALAGKRPFDGDNVGQVFKAIALDPPVPLAERREGLPPALLALVGKMLTHARDERPKRLDAVRAVLLPFVDEASATPVDVGTAATLQAEAAARARTAEATRAPGADAMRASRRLSRSWPVGVTAAVVLVGGLLWLGRSPARGGGPSAWRSAGDVTSAAGSSTGDVTSAPPLSSHGDVTSAPLSTPRVPEGSGAWANTSGAPGRGDRAALPAGESVSARSAVTTGEGARASEPTPTRRRPALPPGADPGGKPVAAAVATPSSAAPHGPRSGPLHRDEF